MTDGCMDRENTKIVRVAKLYRVFRKNCVFYQEFTKVCQFSLASTRLLMVLQKDTSQKVSDCKLALRLRALKVSYSNVGEGGVAVNCEKKTIFPEHPVWWPWMNQNSIGFIPFNWNSIVLKNEEKKY